MADPIFGFGSTVTYAIYSGGSYGAAVTIDNLKSLSGGGFTIAFGDITKVADTKKRRKPGRIDDQQLTLECMLDDTTVASNQLPVMKAVVEAKSRVKITVNFASTVDDTTKIVEWEGYFAGYNPPGLADSDEPLMYSFTFQPTNLT